MAQGIFLLQCRAGAGWCRLGDLRPGKAGEGPVTNQVAFYAKPENWAKHRITSRCFYRCDTCPSGALSQTPEPGGPGFALLLYSSER